MNLLCSFSGQGFHGEMTHRSFSAMRFCSGAALHVNRLIKGLHSINSGHRRCYCSSNVWNTALNDFLCPNLCVSAALVIGKTHQTHCTVVVTHPCLRGSESRQLPNVKAKATLPNFPNRTKSLISCLCYLSVRFRHDYCFSSLGLHSEAKRAFASHKTPFTSCFACIWSHVRLRLQVFSYSVIFTEMSNFKRVENSTIIMQVISVNWTTVKVSLPLLLFLTFSCQLTEAICSLLHEKNPRGLLEFHINNQHRSDCCHTLTDCCDQVVFVFAWSAAAFLHFFDILPHLCRDTRLHLLQFDPASCHHISLISIVLQRVTALLAVLLSHVGMETNCKVVGVLMY